MWVSEAMNRLVALLIVAGAMMIAACASTEPPDVAAPVIPTATPIQLPSESVLDRERNDRVNEANPAGDGRLPRTR